MNIILEHVQATPTIESQEWDSKYNKEEILYTPQKAEYYALQDIWKLLKRYLEPQKHYLDVGCGTGTWILFLKEKGYKVDGCDITPQTIKRLQEYDPSLNLNVANILRLPYDTSSFDGLITIGVLEYLGKDIVRGLDEVKRVVKPGGLFFVEVPLRNTLRILFYLPIKHLKYYLGLQGGRSPAFDNYYFKREELKNILTKNGFTVLEMAPHEMPHPKCHHGLYNDWAFLRGKRPKHLNWLGLVLKYVFNALSPWIAATGILLVAKRN